MELIKLPTPMRVIWGSLAAWWLAQIINPGFNAVAVMLLFMIPVLANELYLVLPKKRQTYSANTSAENNSEQENAA